MTDGDRAPTPPCSAIPTPTPRRSARTPSSSSASAPRSRPTARSRSPGSWSGRCTSQATATTAGPRRGPGLRRRLRHRPGAHPIFGAAIGRLLEQAWEAMGRPAPFVVTRPAPARAPSPPACLAGCATPGRRSSPRSATAPSSARTPGSPRSGSAWRPPASRPPRRRTAAGRPHETGAVVANEVLDALPVHRVVGRPGGLRERFVGVDGDEVRLGRGRAEHPRRSAAASTAEGVELGDGQVTEVCLALDDWLAGATAHLGRGAVVLVDYADEPAGPALDARDPDGHAPGVRAPRRRRRPAPPRRPPGPDRDRRPRGRPRRRGGRRPRPAGRDDPGGAAGGGRATSPRRGSAGPARTLEDALLLRSALARLLDPRGMGGFRVLVFGRGMPPAAALPALRRIDR